MRAFYLLSCLLVLPGSVVRGQAVRPNVLIILTDDQGYGDLACHGNPYLRTPHLDALHARSIRLTDFHVGTTCAPSRAALLTGRDPNRVGVWHTILGRHWLRPQEQTLADLLSQAGYRTALFGKWHLGDTYPFRPQDRGFQEVLTHGGGGVGQTPDFWNNDYHDDTYCRNGRPERQRGYCTDVWAREAEAWMQRADPRPFFCYLALNAPHEPYNVPGRYAARYASRPEVPEPRFYGMIEQLDERLGALLARLEATGQLHHTIVLFMTDNGTAAGAQLDAQGFVTAGYNAGMRGKKTSPYEGGHRVPCWLYWPAGGWSGGRDLPDLCAHIDLAPTLLDACGLTRRPALPFDGLSLVPRLNGTGTLPTRTLVVDTQRGEHLEPHRPAAVMRGAWRLVNGRELYDLRRDPGQRQNLAGAYPDTVAHLRQAYERWWHDVAAEARVYARAVVSRRAETVLTAHDLHTAGPFPAWHQAQVRAATGAGGFWALHVAEAGRYRLVLSRYPRESRLRLRDSAPARIDTAVGYRFAAGVAIAPERITVQGLPQSLTWVPRRRGRSARWRGYLDAGPLDLSATWHLPGGRTLPVQYAYLRRAR